jgi:catechol 2,3-dioxygenase-like lactoylglutathione lyase family enzyme
MPTLNLLVLRCKDIAVTRGLYAALGFVFERHQHGKGPEHLASESDGFVLELYPAPDGRADNAALGFAVDDLNSVRQRLVESGFSPGDVRDEPWGRVCVVRDADGRRVELKQR